MATFTSMGHAQVPPLVTKHTAYPRMYTSIFDHVIVLNIWITLVYSIGIKVWVCPPWIAPTEGCVATHCRHAEEGGGVLMKCLS